MIGIASAEARSMFQQFELPVSGPVPIPLEILKFPLGEILPGWEQWRTHDFILGYK